MATRQTGFALMASNNPQEVMDFALIAQAATLNARVPFLHFFDGFRTSHEVMKIEQLSLDDMHTMIDDDLVIAHRKRALTPDKPVLRGTAQNPDVFFQARETVNPFYTACPGIVQQQMDKFAQLVGRQYHLFDYVGAKDAEKVIVMMGSGSDAAEETVNYLNQKGEKLGLVKVRLYRPFSIYVLSFSTYNEFTCSGVVNQSSFEPRLAIEVVFSNPVSQREVARHMTFDPPIPFDIESYYDYSESHMYFSLPLRAEQVYTMTILDGLKDLFGNDLTGKRVFTFKTGSFRPSVRMVTGQGILEAYESHKYPVTFTNVDSVTLQLARVNPEKIVDIMQRLDYSYYQQLAWEQAILEWVTTVGEDPALFSVSRVWKPSIKRNEPAVRPVG